MVPRRNSAGGGTDGQLTRLRRRPNGEGTCPIVSIPHVLHHCVTRHVCEDVCAFLWLYVALTLANMFEHVRLVAQLIARTHATTCRPFVLWRACRASPDWSDGVHTPRSPHPNHDQHHTPEQVHARVPVLGTGTRSPPHSRRKAPPAQREVGWAPTPTPAFIGGVTGWVWAASLL